MLALHSLKSPIRRKWLRRSFLGSLLDPGVDQHVSSRTSEEAGEGSHLVKRKKGREEDKNVEILKVSENSPKGPGNPPLRS